MKKWSEPCVPPAPDDPMHHLAAARHPTPAPAWDLLPIKVHLVACATRLLAGRDPHLKAATEALRLVETRRCVVRLPAKANRRNAALLQARILSVADELRTPLRQRPRSNEKKYICVILIILSAAINLYGSVFYGRQ